MSKNVLVTGAAGFLGSHLVEHHISRGDVVFGVDNYSSSRKTSKHQKKLLDNLNYSFLEVDICSTEFVSRFRSTSFDIIYNFACPASPPIYQKLPIETMLTCVVGTQNVLSLAKKSTVLVHASTSEIYGDPAVSPQSEDYRGNVNSYGPRACYDEGKRAAEALCFDYRNKHDIDARLVRIFNTYGPHMDIEDGRVITNFIGQALKNQSLSIYGDGLQTRSFCYVDDLIRGITSLAYLKDNPGTPVNIGNPVEFTIEELAGKIQKLFGVKIERLPLPVDDPMQRCPDISLAKNLLGWEPMVQLDEGLDLTIKYFSNV